MSWLSRLRRSRQREPTNRNAPDGPATQTAAVPVPEPRPPADDVSGMARYATFKVLLDEPAAQPGLSFDRYATVLADTIVHSRAEFAVGIFGSWGSGKTTLMRAIERRLSQDANVVSLWFAAWRYEKEPNLLLPLLDVLADTLAAKGSDQDWARHAAVAVAAAGQAILEGVQVSAGPPGIQVQISPGVISRTFRDRRSQPPPLSSYHKGYKMLREAIQLLSAAGTRRVVIFIDDLDRCLPTNALEVLESMKLFFDAEGCVFVVGLDQEIAERAVALKYAKVADQSLPPRSDAGDEPRQQGIVASDYLKKLFQVSFALPQIKPQQLPEFLETIEQTSDFSPAQRSDFADKVRRHFAILQGESLLNAREIKRLINLYTLQLKMLAPRIGSSLNPNVVLALLCMSYRTEWQALHERLTTDPRYVQSTLREALSGADWPRSVWLAGAEYALPADLVEYLRGLAGALLRENDLAAYVSAAESTSSSDPWVLEARTMLSRLRRTTAQLAAGEVNLENASRRISSDVGSVSRLVQARREAHGQLGSIRQQLLARAAKLMEVTQELLDSQDENVAGFLERWEAKAVPEVTALDAGLLEWHRYISLGG